VSAAPAPGDGPIPGCVVVQIRRLRRSGITVAHLAARFGRTRAEIRRALDRKAREATNRVKQRGRNRAKRDATIRALRAAGWSLAAVAKRYRLAESTVSGIAPMDGEATGRVDPPAPPAPPLIHPPRPAPPAPPMQAPAAAPWRACGAPAVGSENGRSKLTEAGAAELRRLRREDPKRWTYPALARRFRVSRSNVFYVLKGRTWKDGATADPGPVGPR